MVQTCSITLPAKATTLHDLTEKFGLQLVEDKQFLREWQDELPEITEPEKQRLDRVKASYSNLSEDPPLLENTVKMVVLSPLLDLAGRVIESKQAAFSLEVGRSQLLTYMLANPHPDRPTYGLLTNENSFLLIKLIQLEPPQYSLSRLFYIHNPGNDLYHVLQVLKRLAQLSVTNYSKGQGAKVKYRL